MAEADSRHMDCGGAALTGLQARVACRPRRLTWNAKELHVNQSQNLIHLTLDDAQMAAVDD